MQTDEFGGVLVDQSSPSVTNSGTDEFGGIPVDLEEAPVPVQSGSSQAGVVQSEAPNPVISSLIRGAAPVIPPAVSDKITSSAQGSIESFSTGALDTSLLGAPDALASRSGVNLNDPNSPEFRHPYARAAGETLGAGLNLTPGGNILKQGIAAIIKRGAIAGAIYGGGQAAFNEAKNPEATSGDIATQGAQGAIAGGLVGGAIPVATTTAIKALTSLPSATKAVASTIGNTISTTLNASERYLSPTRENHIISFLNPGLTGNQFKTIKSSVKRILPQIDDMHEQSGIDARTAEGAAEMGRYAKNKIWDLIQEKHGGEPISIDLTPIANKLDELSLDKSLNIALPREAAELKSMATQYRKEVVHQVVDPTTGKLKDSVIYEPLIVDAKTAEDTLKVLNAVARAEFKKSTRDAAASEMTNGEIRASKEAAAVLRQQLDKAIEGYGDLKKDYGAWANFQELAEREAGRQAKLQGQPGLSTILGTITAIASGQGFLKSAATFAAGKALRVMGTPDYKAARAFPKAFKKADKVMVNVGGKTFLSEVERAHQNSVKVKMRDGKTKTVAATDVSPAPVPPTSSETN